ncbi:hypothetical protein [Lysinibacillus xylanilyticus]|uniref:Uncharacterized protein n=1 Tax=Lysinibacillus xylanilyticus TaxID=582475 RepID=A0ABT4ETQ1_9BACI|nr:hypothetical protein [Lysinibacillus xylanilyticus]MCY9549005.1 hypothetical protein [Lysinibacillus xylanilyticus]
MTIEISLWSSEATKLSVRSDIVHEVDVDIFRKLGDKLKKLVDKSIKLVDKQSKVLDKS